jgi:hypothetical protein
MELPGGGMISRMVFDIRLIKSSQLACLLRKVYMAKDERLTKGAFALQPNTTPRLMAAGSCDQRSRVVHADNQRLEIKF